MKLPNFSFRKKAKIDPHEESEEKNIGPIGVDTTSSGGGKQWLILHLEKIVLATAVIVFVLLIYSAVGKLSLNRKQDAKELANKADQMEALIEQSDWDGSADQIPDFAAQVKEANKPIGQDNYSFKSLVGFEARKIRKRTWPKFLPAESVWVEGGSGIFWISKQTNEEAARKPLLDDAPQEDENSITLSPINCEGEFAPKNATAEIKHWAAITALIPTKQQTMLYERTFQEAEAYQPLEDVPNYVLARIKRVEIDPDDPTGTTNIDWENPDYQWEWAPQLAKNQVNVSETALGRLQPRKHDRWATEARELVDARYVHPKLTTPLGPLGYTSWHQWATHPEIPFSQSKPLARAGNAKRKIRGGIGNRIPDNRGGRDNEPQVKNNNTPNRDNQFTDFFEQPDKGLEKDSSNQKNVPDKEEKHQTAKKIADENQLLRLFDFNVEPGKTYVYQVQLLLKNPNHNKPSRILRDPGHRKPMFVPDKKLPWSKQSAPVYIPPLTEVYASAVADSVEKEATVIIKTPTGSEGALIISELTLPQGGVVATDSIKTGKSYKMDGLSRKLIEGEDPLNAELLLVDIRSQTPFAGQSGISDLLFLDISGEFLLKSTGSGIDQDQARRFSALSSSFEQAKEKQKREGKNNAAKDGKGKDGKEQDEDLLK
jgi:hypothetical protein